MLTRTASTLRNRTEYVDNFNFDNFNFIIRRFKNKNLNQHYIIYNANELTDDAKNVRVIELQHYRKRLYFIGNPSKHFNELVSKDDLIKKVIVDILTEFEKNNDVNHEDKLI